jgi:F-type H+-transporting ATPase subunit b
MRFVPALLVFLTSYMALAAEGHDAHSNEIPAMVKWQVINLAILGAILYKYGKQPMVDFFQARQTDYLKQAEKSKVLFQEAEKEYQDIEQRLKTLNATAADSVEKAKKDAEGVRKNMVAEAQATAARIKDEAQTTAKIESQKTTLKAKQDIVLQSLMTARQVLTTDIGSQDHQKLQSEFNKNIEAVNP